MGQKQLARVQLKVRELITRKIKLGFYLSEEIYSNVPTLLICREVQVFLQSIRRISRYFETKRMANEHRFQQ